MKLGCIPVLCGILVSTHGAPNWMQDTYKDMMSSFGKIHPPGNLFEDVQRSFNHEFDEVGDQLEEISDYWGDHLETVGSQMGSRFRKFGGQMEDQMNIAKDQMKNMGSSIGNMWNNQLRPVGSSIESAFNRQFGNFDRNFAKWNDNVNTHMGRIGANFDNFGTSLMSQFDRSFSHNIDDVFGMFGKQRTPWWQKENVCVKREVLEEDDEEVGKIHVQISGNANFHMQVKQCVEKSESYECVRTMVEDGAVKTLRMTHSCCHGYKNIDGEVCASVDIKPLEETIAELEAEQFLELLVENDLEHLMNNVTIFAPNDEAIRDLDFELEELYMNNEIENVVYNIDDGLLKKRRKRNVIPMNNAANLLKGHFLNGFHNIHDLVERELVETMTDENDQVRVTIYPTKPPTVMANCAKVISRNNHATNGIVHVVDKVVVPASDTIAEVLSADLHFKTLISSLESNNLIEMLSEPGHYTIFAPTDEAFEKLDEATRMRILGNGGCSSDLIRSHILSEVVCSGIVDAPVKVKNIAGHDMTLSSDEHGNIEIDGIKLFMKDKMTKNGVIHVIEDVIVQPEVINVIDHLKKKNSNKLLNLLQSAGMMENFENLKNLTFFMPSEKAISEIPKAVLDELKKDKTKLSQILKHHITTHSTGSCHLKNNQHLDTLGGRNLRINLHNHFGQPGALGMVQCARIIQSDTKVCGGRVHTIDRVLTPPVGDVMMTLESSHPKFANLIKKAKLDTELSQGLLTVLAPLDTAFDKLEADIGDDEVEDVVRNHLVESPLCCASVLRSSGFLHERRVRSKLGDALSFHRSNGGHIYANQAAIVSCDQAATNGVVHSIDSIILPRNMSNKKKKSFWSTGLF